MIMHSAKRIFCIIPAYNEAETITKVINDVRPYVSEIVVVDDGSADRTGELAEKQGVTVLRHIINRGQGAALETGNQYALAHGADIIIHFDADGQFVAPEIKVVVQPILDINISVSLSTRFLTSLLFNKIFALVTA